MRTNANRVRVSIFEGDGHEDENLTVARSMNEYRVARAWRDARVTKIWAGSNEIMNRSSDSTRAVGSTPHRPLRVCQLAYTYYDFDNRVLRYAEYLADRGDRVDVIALRFPKGPPLGDSGNIRVFRIQSRSRNEKAAWVYLAKILWFFVKSAVLLAFLQLRGRHDVVHVHNVPEFLVFAALVPKLFGARVILDIHDIGPELYGGKFGTKPGSRMFKMMVFVERMSCRFADHVIVANHIWHKKLIQRSVPPRKCTPIMTGRSATS